MTHIYSEKKLNSMSAAVTRECAATTKRSLLGNVYYVPDSEISYKDDVRYFVAVDGNEDSSRIDVEFAMNSSYGSIFYLSWDQRKKLTDSCQSDK